MIRLSEPKFALGTSMFLVASVLTGFSLTILLESATRPFHSSDLMWMRVISYEEKLELAVEKETNSARKTKEYRASDTSPNSGQVLFLLE